MLPYDPSVKLQGRVAYIYPYLNTDTRTLSVRFDVPNPGLVLKPGMYANVDLSIDQGEQVLVPADAVMDTGERQIVFVAGEKGTFINSAMLAKLLDAYSDTTRAYIKQLPLELTLIELLDTKEKQS